MSICYGDDTGEHQQEEDSEHVEQGEYGKPAHEHSEICGISCEVFYIADQFAAFLLLPIERFSYASESILT